MASKKAKIALLTSGAIGGLLATSIALSSCTFEVLNSNQTQSNPQIPSEYLSREINWDTITPGNNNFKTDETQSNQVPILQGVYYDAESGLAYTDESKTILLGVNPDYNLSKIVIPESVRVIGQYYNITNGPTDILTGAFENQTSLRTISFSDTKLNAIGNNAFKGCYNLDPIQLPDSITSIGNNAFEGAFINSKNDFNFSAPSSLKLIGNETFKDSKIKSFNLANATNVKIGSSVFVGCQNLTTMNLSNAEIIGLTDKAFENLNFTKLTFSNGNSTNNEGELVLPAYLLEQSNWPTSTNSNGAVQGGVFKNSKITTINFDDGVSINKLPDYVFANMTSLVTIENLPKTIKVIGKYAFSNTAIETFDDKNGWATLDNLLEIGDGTFANCSNLKSVKISNQSFGLNYDNNYNVSTDGILRNLSMQNVFLNTLNLEIVDMENTKLSTIGSSCFQINDAILNESANKPKLTTIKLPSSVWWYGPNAFLNQTNLRNLPNLANTNIEGLKNNTSNAINTLVFSVNSFKNTGFSKISIAPISSENKRNIAKAADGEIVLPNIGNINIDFRVSGENGVFTGMQNLETIDLSNLANIAPEILNSNAARLNGFIFNQSPKLANIEIAGAIPAIPAYAFKSCTNLQNADFTKLSDIRTIGRGAFQGSSIETVDLSNCKKLTTIDQDAFRNANIQFLDLSQCEVLTTIQNNAFTDIAQNAETPLTLKLPASLTTINNNTFWAANINELIFPEGSKLQTIGNDAFRNTKINIIDFSGATQLRSIGNNAFQSSPNLKEVKFAKNTNISLGNGVFRGSGLTTVDLSNTAMTSLSNNLFRDCTNLTELKLPNTINTFGNESLRGTTSLTKLDLTNLTNGTIWLNQSAFYGSGFTEISTQEATGGTTAVSSLAFPKNREIIIGNYVFSAMPNLTKAVFESSSTTNSTNGSIVMVQNMFDSSSRLATIDLSKCLLPIVGQNGDNSDRTANFRNTAVQEIKIGNYSNQEVQTGQLLLTDNINTIKNYQFSQMPSLTKLNFTEATKLSAIWNNPWDQSSITEIQFPVSQKLEVTPDLSIENDMQSLIRIYENSFNAAAIQKLTETMPVTNRIVKWGNINTEREWLTCNPNSIINNANIQTIDLTQLEIPFDPAVIVNGIGGVPYLGSIFPPNSINWNVVSLSGQFRSSMIGSNLIFDSDAFDKIKANWNTIQFGHNAYKDSEGNITSQAVKISTANNLAIIMNNFGGLLYTPISGSTSGAINMVNDGAEWKVSTTPVTAPAKPVEGFGSIQTNLDKNTVITGWTGTGTKTKVHNGITWTYTPSDAITGALAYIEATVSSVKIAAGIGQNVVRYFSGTPALGTAEEMVSRMKKKTIRAYFDDNAIKLTN